MLIIFETGSKQHGRSPGIIYTLSIISIQVENSHQRHDGMIADYCDGQIFQQHPLFSQDPCALQIILYYDDVEVVNPLGSKTSKHKVGNNTL